ncbi:AI-2E family transporter [Faecalicatena orotica]|uniref:Putative PurR-regulated permease PerM n=2 Tax=Bacillota TaxID=1239 RepID=A0A2Y9B9V4_9FIRM|nr:putative PurR-regulated permease PerM [Faecalicatena orotica]SSA54383.1 Predicted PurR-regulated permease PerM [Faecalicatena orotica]
MLKCGITGYNLISAYIESGYFMEFNKENLRKIRGLILFTLVVLIALWKYTVVLEALGFLLGIMFPFLLGAAIAFILNVPMHFLEEKLFYNKNTNDRHPVKKLARPLSLVLTIIIVLGVVSLVIFVVVPKLGGTFMSLGKNIQDFVPKVQSWVEEMFNNNKEIVAMVNDIKIDWDKVLNGMVSFFKNGAGSVLGSTFTVAKSIVSGLATFFIAFVFACYILLQKEKLNIQIRKIMYAYLKEEYVEKALDVCSLTYKTFSSFLTGQCVEAVILGAMFVVTMTVFRLPYAMLVGILIAFTALIPIFGAFIGCVVGAFLILMVAPMKALVFVVLFLVLQQIEGNLIYPRVVGSSVGLPSIWVLAAVSIGGSLMGIVGMLVFIPIVSVVYTLFRNNVYWQLKKKGIQIDNTTGESVDVSGMSSGNTGNEN